MNALIVATAPGARPAAPSGSYHDAVSAFKRGLIESTLLEASGNRTHAARALGLQRTYLLRLIRELRVAAPPAPTRGRPAGPGPAKPSRHRGAPPLRPGRPEQQPAARKGWGALGAPHAVEPVGPNGAPGPSRIPLANGGPGPRPAARSRGAAPARPLRARPRHPRR